MMTAEDLKLVVQVVGGGCIGLGALYLILKFKPWKNGRTELRVTEGASPAGELTVSEWDAKFRLQQEQLLKDIEKILGKELDEKLFRMKEALMADIRSLMNARNQWVTQIVREAVREENKKGGN